MSETKFLSFDTWWGGLNNIRMTYELVGALSVLTGRKIILPPKIYCLFLSEHQRKSSFFDFWTLFDKDAFTEQFDCVEYNEIKKYKKFNTKVQYFDNICQDIKCIPNADHPNWGPGLDILQSKLSKEDLDTNDTYIHFPRNLFGHWYHLLPVENEEQKALIKRKLKNGLKLKSKYDFKPFKDPYNAIHVRSGDFKFTRTTSTETLFNNLRTLVDKYITPTKPLYIATDEKDRSKFECLNGYNCFYLEDFRDVDQVAAIAMDTLACTNAEEFYGSRYSTFTDYINILRHYRGEKDCSKTLLNYTFTGEEPMSWENCIVTEY